MGSDRRVQNILERASFQHGINGDSGHGAGEIGGQDRALTSAHQRCSIRQRTPIREDTDNREHVGEDLSQQAP